MHIVKIPLALFMFAMLLIGSAMAHQPSTAYLEIELLSQERKQRQARHQEADAEHIQRSAFSGQWKIDLKDLELAVGLDLNGDAEIKWGELRRQQNAVFSYALSHLKIGFAAPAANPAANGSASVPLQDCKLVANDLLVEQRSESSYAVVRFKGFCPRPESAEQLDLNYSLLFDQNRNHQAHFKFTQREHVYNSIFSVESGDISIPLAAAGYIGSPWDSMGRYVLEGIKHLLVGLDHILFLLCLMLPLALLPKPEPAEDYRPRFGIRIPPIIALVTAFTLGHSITLILASLELIPLPIAWVEIAIAISVLLAALNNIFSVISHRHWLLAFGFGLLHGLGFAAVLQGVGLPAMQLLVSLLGFNLGVEFGQLLLVAVVFPVLLMLPLHSNAKKRLLQLLSIVIAAIAVYWVIQRIGAL